MNARSSRKAPDPSHPTPNLYPVGSLGAEHKDGAGKWIMSKRLAHQRDKAVRTFAEIDRLGRHQNAHSRRGPRSCDRLQCTNEAATVLTSALPPTRMVTPSISTSMMPLVWCLRRRPSRLVALPTPLRPGSLMTAGTNAGAVSAAGIT
jgi:hypothetical protein